LCSHSTYLTWPGSPPALVDRSIHLSFDEPLLAASRGTSPTVILTQALPAIVAADAIVVIQQPSAGPARPIALHPLFGRSCSVHRSPSNWLDWSFHWGSPSPSNALYISPASADARLQGTAHHDWVHTPLYHCLTSPPPWHTVAGVLKHRWKLPLQITLARKGRSAVNALAEAYERRDVVCREKTVGVSKKMPACPGPLRMRGAECIKVNRKVLPHLQPAMDPLDWMAFFLIAHLSYGLYVLVDKGPYESQLYLYGGAPKARSGLPRKPRDGQVGFRDEDNMDELETLITALFEGDEKLTTALMSADSRFPPSSHNLFHVIFEHFLAGWGGNYETDKLIELLNTRLREITALFGRRSTLGDRVVLSAMVGIQDMAWEAAFTTEEAVIQTERSRVQLIEHEKTGARHAEALGCITQFVLPSCAISGAALARADAADAAAATAADAATAAIAFAAALGADPADIAIAAEADYQWRLADYLATTARAEYDSTTYWWLSGSFEHGQCCGVHHVSLRGEEGKGAALAVWPRSQRKGTRMSGSGIRLLWLPSTGSAAQSKTDPASSAPCCTTPTRTPRAPRSRRLPGCEPTPMPASLSPTLLLPHRPWAHPMHPLTPCLMPHRNTSRLTRRRGKQKRQPRQPRRLRPGGPTTLRTPTRVPRMPRQRRRRRRRRRRRTRKRRKQRKRRKRRTRRLTRRTKRRSQPTGPRTERGPLQPTICTPQKAQAAAFQQICACVYSADFCV
jgi:hypothetical protein